MYLRVQSSPHGERNNKKSTHKWQTLHVCNRANKTYVLSAKTISITDISNSSRLHISISIPMKTNMFSKIGQMNSFEMALLIERSQTIHQIQGKYATYKKKKKRDRAKTMCLIAIQCKQTNTETSIIPTCNILTSFFLLLCFSHAAMNLCDGCRCCYC